MPCSDSSSSIVLHIDAEDRLRRFEYAKITCGRSIEGGTGFVEYCQGKALQDMLTTPFAQICADLDLQEEEEQFILHLEWAALRSAIAHYLGLDNDDYDADRCQITSIEYTEEGAEVALVILPPQAMPKILPCSLGDSN